MSDFREFTTYAKTHNKQLRTDVEDESATDRSQMENMPQQKRKVAQTHDCHTKIIPPEIPSVTEDLPRFGNALAATYH